VWPFWLHAYQQGHGPKRAIDGLTQILIIVGGLNWLLVAAFDVDLVAAIFGGQDAVLSRSVYVLVGLSAIWQLTRLPAMMEDRHITTSTTSTRLNDRP